jgi:hypothetical protein
VTVHTLHAATLPVPDIEETEDGRYLIEGHEWTDEQIRVVVAAYLAAEWGDGWAEAYESAFRTEIVRAWWVPDPTDPELLIRAAASDEGAVPYIEVCFV